MAVLGFGACASQAAPDLDAAPLLRIEVKAHVKAVRSPVLLGDVATLSSPDPVLLSRVMAIPLGYAPATGDAVSLDLAAIERWLRRQTGLRANQLQWSGATSIEVSAQEQRISADIVAAQAQAELRRHVDAVLAQAGMRARVELQSEAGSDTLQVPMDASQWRIRPLDHVALGKHMVVWGDVFSQDRFVRTVPLRFEVSVFTKAPVAATKLAPGTPLRADNIEEREVDLTLLGNGKIWPASTAAAAIQGLGALRPMLRHGVQSGEVLFEANVRIPPAVARGDWARLVMRDGLINLESRVEVLQDGQVGQMVRVKQSNAQGEVMAQVSSPGTVEIHR